MGRRPTTKRKVPDYFEGTTEFRFDYRSGWEVGYWCPELHRWDWESLATVRVSPKLKAEATAAALRLLRASLARRTERLDKETATVRRLANWANRLEQGHTDWSAL